MNLSKTSINLLYYFKLLIALFLVVSCQKKEQQHQDILWYEQPANNWMEAFPVGNGRLGAMVFGNPNNERIQLTRIIHRIFIEFNIPILYFSRIYIV